MVPMIIRGGSIALRTVRPFFSRFAAPGSRLAQTQGSAWSKFLTTVRKSPRLKWFFGIVRDAAVFSAVAGGIDWAVDWLTGDDVTAPKDSSNQPKALTTTMQNIMVNDVVALALDTQSVADVDSQAVILDNYAMTCLASGDSGLTMEGLATAAAAEYLRRTRNSSMIYDLADALNILHNFEEELDGKETFSDLSDQEIQDFCDAIDGLENELSSNDVSRLADLMAFQVSFIKTMQQ